MIKCFTSALLLGLLLIASPVWALDDDTEKFIQEQVDQRLQSFMESELFQAKINEGIIRFIQAQNALQEQAARESEQTGTLQLLPVDPARDHIRGNAEAAFTLLEYSDFECPFCKRFHETAKAFLAKNDDVNWVYRHFPLDFHNPGAQQQAEAAECVAQLGGNDAFWEITDFIYDVTRSNGNGFPLSALPDAAKAAGVDVVAFQKCLATGAQRDRVLQDLANGQQSGVTGTPGNFLIHNVSGTVVVITGAQPLENLENTLAALKQELGL